jgi:hypothetical protein
MMVVGRAIPAVAVYIELLLEPDAARPGLRAGCRGAGERRKGC